MRGASLVRLPLESAQLRRTLGYLHHRGRSLSNAAQAFIDALEQEADVTQPSTG